MTPEYKFALLMVGLMALFPVSVVLVHVLHRALCDGVAIRVRWVVAAGALCFAPGAFAAMPVPIIWAGISGGSGSNSPSQYCGSQWLVSDVIHFGFPTQWLCINSGGSVQTGVITSMPSCPDNYQVDFTNMICTPLVVPAAPSSSNQSSSSSISNLTPVDALAYGSLVALLWATAWGVGAVIRVVRETDNSVGHD